MVRVTFYSLKRVGDSFEERTNIYQLCFNVNETFAAQKLLKSKKLTTYLTIMVNALFIY